MSIDRFIGEYKFLCNFALYPVTYEGICYPTSEHAYQAAKFAPIKTKRHMANTLTPGQVKRVGQAPGIRYDWELVKVDIMREIVTLKFVQNPEIKVKLIATELEELVEGNTWNDTFWGQCPVGNGENNLGKVLMEVRARLR